VRTGIWVHPEGARRPKDRYGYIVVKIGGKWVLEHRYVMEQKLNRQLGRYEYVHHIDGNKANNSPENLELWKRSHPSGVRHADYHCPGCRCFESAS
jgi:hypothetical protein